MFMKFWNTVGVMCRTCLTSPRLSFSAVVIDVELVDGDAETFAVLGEEAAQVVHRAVETLGRVRRSHSGELDNTVVTSARFDVERGEQVAARRQGRHQQLQIAHGAEDVGAVVAERGNRLRQLDHRVARGVTVARAGCPRRC